MYVYIYIHMIIWLYMYTYSYNIYIEREREWGTPRKIWKKKMPLFLGLDLSWDCLMESSLNLELYNASTPKIVRLQKTCIYFSSKKKHDFVPKYGSPKSSHFENFPCPSKMAMKFSGFSGLHLAPVGSPQVITGKAARHEGVQLHGSAAICRVRLGDEGCGGDMAILGGENDKKMVIDMVINQQKPWDLYGLMGFW